LEIDTIRFNKYEKGKGMEKRKKNKKFKLFCIGRTGGENVKINILGNP